MVKLFTVKEVGEMLNVSRECVYSLVESGKIEHHRIGIGRGTIRISEDDLEAYLGQTRVTKDRLPLKYLDV